ncbi:MAG: sigma-E processing peptidase SpoIIGA [Lachnospiraceae bacterium]
MVSTYEAVVRVGKRRIAANAFYDTGNYLRDPLSHLPVVIGEREVFEALVPVDYVSAMAQFYRTKQKNYRNMLEKRLFRLRYIPYRTIGQMSGVLVGILCDEMLLWSDGKVQQCGKFVLACVEGELVADREYQLILQRDMIKQEGS